MQNFEKENLNREYITKVCFLAHLITELYLLFLGCWVSGLNMPAGLNLKLSLVLKKL